MGLRWPGQGGGRGAPPGFPGTSQSPDADPTPDRVDTPENDPEPSDEIRSGHSMSRLSAKSSTQNDEVDVEASPAPRALFAPTSPLRTGEPPARRPRRHSTAGRASRFLSSRWPGLWTGAPPTTVPSGYRRSATPDEDLNLDTGDGDESSDVVVPARPTRTRSHVKVHRDPDSGEEATVTPLPSLRERRSAGSSLTRATDSDTATDSGTDSDSDAGPDTDSGTVAVAGPGVVRRVVGPFQTVVGAVYAALADPLVNAPPEVREKRAAQVRRVGIAAAGTMVACVLVYAIFPVQTYLDLRSSTQRAEEQREALQRANDELERRQAELNNPETVEEIAREDYGMVLPGEESYGVLPAPESTTSTSTTTTAPG